MSWFKSAHAINSNFGIVKFFLSTGLILVLLATKLTQYEPSFNLNLIKITGTGQFSAGQLPPWQLPPRQPPHGQLPPRTIAPQTITPRAIAPLHNSQLGKLPPDNCTQAISS